MARGFGRGNLREDIDQNAVIWNRSLMVGVRPVGAPNAAITEFSHQLPRERHLIVISWTFSRDTARAADLHPDVLVIEQREQRSKVGMIQTERSIDASHVIDDYRDR